MTIEGSSRRYNSFCSCCSTALSQYLGPKLQGSLTLSSTHLSSNLRLLNSHKRPDLVMAYVESPISPRPHATSQKQLLRCSPRIADRPISGTGSLYFDLEYSRYLYDTKHEFYSQLTVISNYTRTKHSYKLPTLKRYIGASVQKKQVPAIDY